MRAKELMAIMAALHYTLPIFTDFTPSGPPKQKRPAPGISQRRAKRKAVKQARKLNRR